MRVLIVGASGQIGGHLYARLRAEGHTVTGTYNTVERAGLVPLDLDDTAALSAAVLDVRPEVVILPAGWTWVDGNERDPERSLRQNCESPLRLCELAQSVGALFVTYSTDYVFDGKTGAPYAEDAATAPPNVYGRSKLALEEAIRASGAEHLILRTTTVYGPEQQGKNFVYQLVRRLGAGEPFVVPSDQIANPSYGPDVADATRALIEQKQRGTWHVAGPDAIDRASFAKLACEVFDLDPSSLTVKASIAFQTTPRPLNAAMDTSKLRGAGITMRGVRAGLESLKAAVQAGGWAPLGPSEA